MRPPIVPPIKCQGIKTKLVPAIRAVVPARIAGRWIEPFCGSCVVPVNIRPKRALLSDTNRHIIKLYGDLKNGALRPATIHAYLTENGELLRKRGEDHYYALRERFNETGDSLAFLFLNRSCFNGVMRFNRKGGFNVPFCRKPERFARAYVTKIVNQVKACAELFQAGEWEFAASDFRQTLQNARPGDLVYVDPPYAGRHVDYFNSWTERDEKELVALLKSLPCDFILSTWYKNQFRTNPFVESEWSDSRFTVNTREHFYHVGSTEELRHPMLEAIITNFHASVPVEKKRICEPGLFDSAEA